MRLHHSADVHRTLRNGLFCALVLVSVTSAGLLFDMANLQEINIYTVFVLGILVTAVLTASRLWSVVTSVLGVLIFNFLFADPRFSFQAVNFGYPLDFVILVGVALLVSTVASNSERLAYRTGILLQTDQLFLKASGVEEILTITVQRLQQLLNRPVVVYAVKGDKLDEPRYYGAADRADDDRAAAEWTYKNLEPSGARTPRFSRAGFLYSLIRTEDRRYGVIGVAAGDRPMSEMEANLVQALLNECALTLERDFYNQKRQEAAVQVRNEKLRADLLRSISHDLRTPLTSVLGSAGLLADNADQLSEQQKHKLYVDIRDDAQWLLGTVENLLAVTRIEDGKLSLRLQPELLGEVIPETLSHFRAQNGRIRFEQEDELLMARMDARLIMQVVANLVAISRRRMRQAASSCARCAGTAWPWSKSRTAVRAFRTKRRKRFLKCFILPPKARGTVDAVWDLGLHCARRSSQHTAAASVYGIMRRTARFSPLPCRKKGSKCHEQPDDIGR